MSGRYPYHMPGHKRNMEGFPMEAYYGIDITEIDGFDNLHCPEGILKELMDRASKLFGAETYLLVNGSTGGILSAISAVLHRGDTLLMARNCHKAAYHAVYLNACKTRYIYPAFLEAYGISGAVSPAELEEKLDSDPAVRAVFLTSPTYDGVVSDIKAIVKAAHSRKLPVIVDEAHGAHFSLDERFPVSAVSCGADLVIHSIHKTLPALTQTALLHVQGEFVDRERLRRFLKIYQTSSPSYILMAGIEQCISILETDKDVLCNQFFKRNQWFEEKIKNLRQLKVFSAEAERFKGKEIFDFDTGKKLISARGTDMAGRALYKLLLEKYGLQMEMAGQDYVTAIMTIMDREEGFCRLADALAYVDGTLQMGQPFSHAEAAGYPEPVFDIFDAMEKAQEEFFLEECAGKISAEFIHIYPPGIPLIVPGERFTKEIAEKLLRYRQQGFMIEGMRDSNKKVSVIRKETYA